MGQQLFPRLVQDCPRWEEIKVIDQDMVGPVLLAPVLDGFLSFQRKGCVVAGLDNGMDAMFVMEEPHDPDHIPIGKTQTGVVF